MGTAREKMARMQASAMLLVTVAWASTGLAEAPRPVLEIKDPETGADRAIDVMNAEEKPGQDNKLVRANKPLDKLGNNRRYFFFFFDSRRRRTFFDSRRRRTFFSDSRRRRTFFDSFFFSFSYFFFSTFFFDSGPALATAYIVVIVIGAVCCLGLCAFAVMRQIRMRSQVDESSASSEPVAIVQTVEEQPMSMVQPDVPVAGVPVQPMLQPIILPPQEQLPPQPDPLAMKAQQIPAPPPYAQQGMAPQSGHFCSACGAPGLEVGVKFCPSCGAPQ